MSKFILMIIPISKMTSIDYHCALVGTILIQGRIYATDKAVLFYSSIFGREKAVMIPLSQVKHISHPQGVLRSIVIETGKHRLASLYVMSGKFC